MYILSGIVSLAQYLQTLKDKLLRYRPEHCPNCGRATPWFHGCYSRKADRSNQPGQSLNPVPIQRYFCPQCRRTCSALPECLPPHRWYLWEVQQTAFLLLLTGHSAYDAAKEIAPSRRSITRWFMRFQQQFHLHKDALCVHFVKLGRYSNFSDFWQACLKKISLGKTMRLCHVAGVPVP